MAACGADPPAAAPVLRLDGIGPLKLGMSGAAALKTGWLDTRKPTPGCQLAPPPHSKIYRLSGPRLPAGVKGSAEIGGGKLITLVLDAGVATDTGVKLGTSTVTEMTAAYRKAGFEVDAAPDEVFQTTFVNVVKDKRMVLAGSAPDSETIESLATPTFMLCE
jgi:hypothetical protein